MTEYAVVRKRNGQPRKIVHIIRPDSYTAFCHAERSSDSTALVRVSAEDCRDLVMCRNCEKLYAARTKLKMHGGIN